MSWWWSQTCVARLSLPRRISLANFGRRLLTPATWNCFSWDCLIILSRSPWGIRSGDPLNREPENGKTPPPQTIKLRPNAGLDEQRGEAHPLNERRYRLRAPFTAFSPESAR